MKDTQYKSFEEKYLSPVGDFGKGAGGIVKGFLTLPTTARKFLSGQTAIQRDYGFNADSIKNGAFLSGLGAGAIVDAVAACNFSWSEWPLYFCLATNIASGIYEIKDADKTRKNIARLVAGEKK